MAWRDRLRPASFRGVPFFIESTDADLGRRVEVLRFPGREDIVGQDLGKDAASFSVTAFLVGADFDEDRGRLEEALLTEGPGTLVHPTRGELLVLVHDRIRVRESRKEGGYCSVTFQCTVSRPQAPRVVSTSGPSAVKAVADLATAAAASDVSAELVTTGLPSSAVASQVTLLSDVSIALGRARATIGTIVSNVASVMAVENQLVTDAEAILAAPDTLSSAIAAAFYDLFEDAAALVDATVRIGTVTFDPEELPLRRRIVRATRQAVGHVIDGVASFDVDTSSPVAEQETTNLRAISSLVKASALAAYVHASASFPWSSYQEAMEAKVVLLAWLDDAEAAASDATYQALRDLRVVASAQLDSIARTLPFLRSYSPPVPMSALLIAQELYGDARRESEIVARNDLPDPSMVLPYQVLEVASA